MGGNITSMEGSHHFGRMRTSTRWVGCVRPRVGRVLAMVGRVLSIGWVGPVGRSGVRYRRVARPIRRVGAYGRVDALALPVGARALPTGGSIPSMEGMRSLHRGGPSTLSCGRGPSRVWIDHQH